LGLILAESVSLALGAGLAGCLAALALVRLVDMYTLSRGLFVSFEVTPDILARSLFAAGLLGLLSSILPAIAGLRPTIAQGVRAID
jgi:ABC-type antimicrobial peptide transport system permease subunit